MSDNANGLPPANWYPDPRDPTQQRYWDGQSWTVQTRPVEAQAPQPTAVDPTPAAAASAEPAQPTAATPGLAPETQQVGGAASASLMGGQVGSDPAAAGVTGPAVGETVAAAQAAESADLAAAAEAALAGAATAAGVAQPGPVESVAAESAQAPVLSTTSELPGHRVTSVVGVICGVAVRPVGTASERDALLPGRQAALASLQADAAAQGATAVVGVRFDTIMNSDGSAEIAAYGTAVITESA